MYHALHPIPLKNAVYLNAPGSRAVNEEALISMIRIIFVKSRQVIMSIGCLATLDTWDVDGRAECRCAV